MTPKEQHHANMQKVINERNYRRVSLIFRLTSKTPFKGACLDKKMKDTLASRIRNGLINYGDEDWEYLLSKCSLKQLSNLVSLGTRRHDRIKFKERINEYYGLKYTY